jgi:transcriptional regulator with XRE-family HTH domain
MSLGQRIKQLREENSMTQGQLAMRAGISSAYVSRLEDDRNPNASAKVVVHLARALGTTIEDLLSSAGYYDKPIRALPDLSVYLRQVTTLDSRSIQEVLDFIEFKENRLRGRLEHTERLRGVS